MTVKTITMTVIMMMLMMMKKNENNDHCCHFLDSCCIKLVLLFSGTLHRFEEMEEKRHEREFKFRLEMRREEREHELRVLQMMMQMKGCNSQ